MKAFTHGVHIVKKISQPTVKEKIWQDLFIAFIFAVNDYPLPLCYLFFSLLPLIPLLPFAIHHSSKNIPHLLFSSLDSSLDKQGVNCCV